MKKADCKKIGRKYNKMIAVVARITCFYFLPYASVFGKFSIVNVYIFYNQKKK